MNKKLMEYLIMATAVILLIYCCYAMIEYDYRNTERQASITDSISIYYPSSSEYIVIGDKIEFRNSFYDFYDMDVCKLSSDDKRVSNILNHFSNFDRGTIDYKNESCYLISMEYLDANGFKYHSMIIPYDSFNKDNLSFSKNTDIYLFDGKNREFVVDTAFNSQVVI